MNEWQHNAAVIGDAITTAVLFSVPYFLRRIERKKNLPENVEIRQGFHVLRVFVFACGTHHFVEVLNQWLQDGSLHVAASMATAAASVWGLSVVIRNGPKLWDIFITKRDIMARIDILSGKSDELRDRVGL